MILKKGGDGLTRAAAEAVPGLRSERGRTTRGCVTCPVMLLRHNEAMHVSADTLFCGAAFALQQCGRHLEDATVLLEHGRHSGAALLAMLAREEMGRSEILLQLRERANAGEQFTVDHVNRACDDHVIKHEHSQHSLAYHGQAGSQIDQLIRTKLRVTPDTREWKEADRRLKALDERRLRRTPQDRHETRMKAAYVDLTDAGWARPSDLKPLDCYHALNDALNDYRGARDRFLDRLVNEHPNCGEVIDLPAPAWISLEAFIAADNASGAKP